MRSLCKGRPTRNRIRGMVCVPRERVGPKEEWLSDRATGTVLLLSTIARAGRLIRPSTTHHTPSYCICVPFLYWLPGLSGKPASLVSAPVPKWCALRAHNSSSASFRLGHLNSGIIDCRVYSTSLVTVASTSMVVLLIIGLATPYVCMNPRISRPQY